MAAKVIEGDHAMKILVADDSTTYRGIFQALLSQWGFDVILAADGQQAFRLYQEGNGALLALVDWEMPNMSGVELCQQLRKTDSIVQPYIIMVTTKEEGADKVCALDAGADDFVPKPFNEEELRARLRVGERTISLQQHLLQSLMELERTTKVQQQTEQELRRAFSETKGLVASISLILIEIDLEGKIQQWNDAATETFDISASSVIGKNIGGLAPKLWEWSKIMQGIIECEEKGRALKLGEILFMRPSGKEGILEVTLNPLFTDEGIRFGLLLLGEDITERKQLEAQLGLAQKMESIGQLAAGIAHEINTPTQFVSDNLRFLTESFGDIQKVLTVYEQVIKSLPPDVIDRHLLTTMENTVAEADLEYVSEEIPKALQQSLDGSERVGKIVQAMKEFSHPGTTEKKPIDLNKAIESTITVARNEWKYVADVVTDFDPQLPVVPCLPGEFNQVILNLLINAAHAIETALGPEAEVKGTITVTTRITESSVEIWLTDTGTGIPEAVRKKLFDPFFTTKEVGKGTGQGLAIAHDVIVNKHGGTLTFESTIGVGTTFIIQLPCDQVGNAEEHDEAPNLVC